MIDVALVPTGETLDVELVEGDLRLEEGLTTCVLVSLFSDGLAREQDPLPDEGTDRRGWWAGIVLERDRGDEDGSRLWLLERERLSDEVLVRAEEYGREALSWLVREGIAERIEATASRLDLGTMLLELRIVRGSAKERADLWAAQLEVSLEVGPARFDLVAVP